MRKLILSFLLMLVWIPVYAKEETFYYDEERVEEMWITKVNSEETRSAHPYILKRRSDNTYVYCLEPFEEMENDVDYILDNDYTKYGLTKAQMDKVNLIIYYGYGYGNHNTDKWYGVTQYMIWEVVDTDSKFYFTLEKNGEKKDLYVEEMNEIESLIEKHNLEPEFIKDYELSIEQDLVLESNVDLSNYEIITDLNYKIDSNKLIFSDVQKGNYEVGLRKKVNSYKTDYLLYKSNKSQDVIIPGNSNVLNKEYSFNINVYEGELILEKISSFDNTKLEGAIYGIYKGDELVNKITTDKKGYASIILPLGEYTLRELEAPDGYKIDEKIYDFVIDKDNLIIKKKLVDDKEIIDIPDTGLKSKRNCCFIFILLGFIGLVYEKKKYCMY